jgi:hypothetical protein
MRIGQAMKRYKNILRDARAEVAERKMFEAVMRSIAEQQVEDDREDEREFIMKWARENNFQL